MSDINTLTSRLEGAIKATMEKVKTQQQKELQNALERKKLLAAYEGVQAKVVEIFKPRLQALANRAGDRVKVTPTVSETRRAVTFEFKSPKANITLNYAVAPDYTLKNAVVQQDLTVVPVLWHFETHGEISTPVESPDYNALTQWLDDHLVKFVELFMTIHEAEIFDKADFVTDPHTKLEFPKFAAGAVHEDGGQKLYFVSEATKADYLKNKAK